MWLAHYLDRFRSSNWKPLTASTSCVTELRGCVNRHVGLSSHKVSWIIFLLQMFPIIVSVDTVFVTLFSTMVEIISSKVRKLLRTGWLLGWLFQSLSSLVKSTQVESTHFNHPSQGHITSSNSWVLIICGVNNFESLRRIIICPTFWVFPKNASVSSHRRSQHSCPMNILQGPIGVTWYSYVRGNGSSRMRALQSFAVICRQALSKVLFSLPGIEIAYTTLFSALLSRLTALACGATWVTSSL